MLVGDILYRWNPLIAEVLIWIGTIGQLLFSTLRVSELWQGGVFEQNLLILRFICLRLLQISQVQVH